MDYLIQINHAFTFAMIPNNPDGLKINTKINNKKAISALVAAFTSGADLFAIIYLLKSFFAPDKTIERIAKAASI